MMIRTQVYLPQSQINYLKDLALTNKTSISEELRMALDESKSIKKETKRKITETTSAQWLLKDFDKIKFEGPADLATSVDKYLYGDD